MWSGVKFLSVVVVAVMAFVGAAADRLPDYGSEQWYALPGMKAVRAAAENGDLDAQYLWTCAIYFAKSNARIGVDTRDLKYEYTTLADHHSIFATPLAGRSPEEAVKAYMKFADFFLAQRCIGEIMLQNNDPEAVSWYEKAALQGDDVSQYNFGRIFVSGKFGKTDVEKALYWYSLAAAQGNAGAAHDLGVMWQRGMFTGTPDMKKAIHYYQIAVDNGNSASAYLLGEIYENGLEGVAVNKDRAIEYYRCAAAKETGVKEMLLNSADEDMSYAFFLADNNKHNEAREYWKRAAEKGHPNAESLLHFNVLFFEKDETLKQSHLKKLIKLADSGDVFVQDMLSRYLRANGEPKSGNYWGCRALGNGGISSVLSSNWLSDEKENLTAEEKELLQGVLLLADSGNAEMQYIASYLCNLRLCPGGADGEFKYIFQAAQNGYVRAELRIVIYKLSDENFDKTDEDILRFIAMIPDLIQKLKASSQNDDTDAQVLIKQGQKYYEKYKGLLK